MSDRERCAATFTSGAAVLTCIRRPGHTGPHVDGRGRSDPAGTASSQPRSTSGADRLAFVDAVAASSNRDVSNMVLVDGCDDAIIGVTCVPDGTENGSMAVCYDYAALAAILAASGTTIEEWAAEHGLQGPGTPLVVTTPPGVFS